ncbi:MAG: zinc dependent phospholipase C family protein [Chitinophagaceae bacterium]
MKKGNTYVVVGVSLSLVFISFSGIEKKWGFFGHRRINRLAVFTLAPEMMPLFKTNIEFLTEHAVDPDKRRYAVKDEASRHFIDLDRWENSPEIKLPAKYLDALAQYCNLYKTSRGQLTPLIVNHNLISVHKTQYLKLFNSSPTDTANDIPYNKFKLFIASKIFPALRTLDEVTFRGEEINDFFNKNIVDSGEVYQWLDTFSVHGILPYYLPAKYNQLVDAFKAKNFDNILRQAAEIGHYIGDAHVPLHTTSNYNGQLTNQLGLHAFWESRIPELFADRDYDYLVGKAVYIKDVEAFEWKVVRASHELVDSVLAIEKRLSVTLPSDQLYCFDERSGTTVRIQCESFAKAYQDGMKGMVEKRMREAILSVGSIWYSAWVDAGQPNLKKLYSNPPPVKSKDDEEIDKAFKLNSIIGRPEN